MDRVSRTLWSVTRTPIPGGRQPASDRLDVQDGDRIDPGKWLIEKEKVWGHDEAPGDLDPAALAARERVGSVLPHPVRPNSVRSRSARSWRWAGESCSVSRMARRFSSTVIFRKTDGSWGRYEMPARARRYMGRSVRSRCPSCNDARSPGGRGPPRSRTSSSCRRRWGRAGPRSLPRRSRARHRAPPFGRHRPSRDPGQTGPAVRRGKGSASLNRVSSCGRSPSCLPREPSLRPYARAR